MSYSLEVKNLTKRYEGFCLDHVGFQLQSGSIMGFIGENGAGKSTTLKAVFNAIHRDEGEVTLLGQPLTHDGAPKTVMEQVGIVMDDCHFHEMLNARAVRNIMAGIYKSWDGAMFSDYLKKFRLPEDLSVKKYSRGMTMKLSIAAALSHHPRLLLLDEPTSGLDPVVRAEILDEFLDFIQDEDHSILLSSHITSDLEKICDTITFIHRGKIVFSKSKDEIIYSYAVLKCTREQFAKVDREDILGFRKNAFGYEILVEEKAAMEKKYPNCTFDSAALEDIMLFYERGEKQ